MFFSSNINLVKRKFISLILLFLHFNYKGKKVYKKPVTKDLQSIVTGKRVGSGSSIDLFYQAGVVHTLEGKRAVSLVICPPFFQVLAS